MKAGPRLWASLVFAWAAFGCAEDVASLSTVEPPPDAGCLRDDSPRRYEIYLVIDVSGSMGVFLNGLAANLESFASAFPREDAQDRRVLVNYNVVAFVNDVRWFPSYEARRMTDAIAVQVAIEQAIAAGSRNTNLNSTLVNAEADENLLDALAAATQDARAAAQQGAAVMVMIATDASFREHPETLSGNVVVESTFAQIRTELESLGARIHAFTPDALDGLTRNYRDHAALTTLPGSTLHSLRDLTTSKEKLRSTLLDIAQASACN